MTIRQNTLTSAIQEAQAKLMNIYSQLDKFEFPQSPCRQEKFKTDKLNPEKINELAEKFPTGSAEEDYIYIFKITGESTNTSALVNKFSAEKTTQLSTSFTGKKDLCRINSNPSSQYLYVGRSQKLRSRIRQHLGANYEGTYALHMVRWCTDISANIEITAYKFENQDNLLVQAIEDALWDKLKPCFGRKGDK